MTTRVKKLIILNIPYALFGLFATKVGEAWRLSEGVNASEKLLHVVEGFTAAFQSPLPSFVPFDLLIGFLFGALLKLMVTVKGKNAKKFRKNHEYGSAHSNPRENIILTQTEGLTMKSRVPNPKYARNKNVLIIGGSGSGKTRFWLKPNLMQLHSSYVVTDPKGSILIECGKLLQKAHYRIKVFNTINFKKSMHYNPFAYVRTEKDILKLVTTLIANTKGEGKAGDDFWVKAETDEDYQNPVDQMFARLGKKDPEHFAVRQYKKFKLAAGKTAKSILISCSARLAVFDIGELREITSYDELELDTLGDEKSALFLIMSDTDSSFNFLISMVYSQLFNLLCEKADDVYGGRLPVHTWKSWSLPSEAVRSPHVWFCKPRVSSKHSTRITRIRLSAIWIHWYSWAGKKKPL